MRCFNFLAIIWLASMAYGCSNAQNFELSASRRALLLLKDRLTPSGLLKLLAKDINDADAAWHTILAKSSANRIPAKSTVHATKATTTNGITSVDAVETWASLFTQYTIPNYGPGPKKAYMEKLSDFPFQAVGEAVLRDGTVFADIHNSFRDKPDGCGIQAVLNVWVPDGAPRDVVEGMKQHQMVEFTNWLAFA
ncbi:hypothetical protein BCR34DRAFT_602084 [Clohesyomyces aquaticus]|uniref:SnoaL-like domain-containing protein n=1 Tax=Clohesyomyces aquaticus TaxID=1231657 RepID=A0A1Y1ZKG1_9PLEO|nr:hypothetical protein BCR34DRAFT_602084 [Clohesyomyces aquaticus]